VIQLTPRTTRVLGRVRRAVLGVTGRPGQLARQQRRLDKQAKQIRALQTALAAIEQRQRPMELSSNRRDVEHGRVTAQMGAFEERMGRLEELVGTGTFVADDAAMAEARSLVEAIRREHAQVRVRMQIVSHYEERLRRVEEALAELYDGDARHQM
jgi:hypothetical protein